MRSDGRKSDELRRISIETDVMKYAEGSAIIKAGNTHVVCSATVEDSVPPFLRDTGSGWVTAEYSMLPRSTHTRNKRDAAKGRVNARAQEIQRLIGRALRSVVDLDKLGEQSIILDCDVMQADGGTRTASITAAFVALHIAINDLIKKGLIDENPIKDFVAAVSVGIINGEPMLDLCYEEDSAADVDMNIVMTGSGDLVEVQGTAEGDPFSVDKLNKLVSLGSSGIKELLKIQESCIK
ncbi:MAG: ribonuclease PH [Candidatus Dadabacteria bacterium]|nr:ribonuclease PH [Candidatus Dadabacteria bacterium]NIX16378.1 ribonuclease PH [Candidatus Dadabacteria bacterium]